MDKKFDFTEVKRGKENVFDAIPDTSDMINVDMNSYGVTRGDSTFPILKTVGLGPCVGVILYHPSTHIAGMAHMIEPSETGASRWTGPHKDLLNMLLALQRNGAPYDARQEIQAHVIGGDENDDLAQIALEQLKKLGINNILTNLRTDENSHSIAFDSRTGKVFRLININEDKRSLYELSSGLFRNSTGAEPTSDARTLK